MRKRFLIVGLTTMALSTLALAQDGPLPDVDPGAAAKTLFEGISAGAWILMCGGGGLVLIYLLRLLLLPNLKGKALAITSTALIGLAALLTSKLAGADWLSAVGVGFGAGLAAGKAWDLIPDAVTTAAEKPIKKRQK